MRIQKFLAQLGYGSRRKIEAMVIEGRITVNNVPACLGQIITGHERIMIDDSYITPIVPLQKLLIYYKPSGEICSKNDTTDKGTCYDRLPETAGNWQAVGRLDVATSGLLLITTTGEWVNFLTHPKNGFERTYWVKVDGVLTEEQLRSLRRGIMLHDGLAVITRYEHLRVSEQYSSCEITVKEGRNRLVRRLFEALGLSIQKLKRLRYGPFSLPPGLKPGQFVEVDDSTKKWLDTCVHRKK